MKKLSIAAILLFTLTSAGCKTISGEDALGVISIVALAAVLFDDDSDSDNDYSYTKPRTPSNPTYGLGSTYGSGSTQQDQPRLARAATRCLDLKVNDDKLKMFNATLTNHCNYKLHVRYADRYNKHGYTTRNSGGKKIYSFNSGGLTVLGPYKTTPVTSYSLNDDVSSIVYAACEYKNTISDMPRFTSPDGSSSMCCKGNTCY